MYEFICVSCVSYMWWLLDIVFSNSIGNYGFTKILKFLQDNDYVRIGRLVSMLVMNTGMPVPVLSRPVAEFVILGRVDTRVRSDHFPPGRDRAMTEKVQINSGPILIMVLIIQHLYIWYISVIDKFNCYYCYYMYCYCYCYWSGSCDDRKGTDKFRSHSNYGFNYSAFIYIIYFCYW